MFLLIGFLSVASATIYDAGYPLYDGTKKLKKATVQAAVDEITKLIDGNLKEDGEKFLIPGIMRLVFHDCIDGCDACLDLAAVENTGLESIVNTLEPSYEKFSGNMSRADFWVIAASRATDMAVEITNQICDNGNLCPAVDPMNLVNAFRWGRFDCPDTPDASLGVELPSVTWGKQRTVDYFAEHFGINAANTVAVLGAHGNSKARGFSNNAQWTENLAFNNQYYQNLLNEDLEWTQVKNDLGVFEWRANNGLIALNPDMAMVKDIQVIDEATGESSCTYATCGKSQGTLGMVKRYASGQTNWSSHFRNHFLNKILNNERLMMPQN